MKPLAKILSLLALTTFAANTAFAQTWTHSRELRLDTTPAGANTTEDVANYPLAIQLDATRFKFDQAQPNGADLRFFDPSGKPLPHSIELWDPQSSKAALWVLLPLVKANSNQQSITMRWGNPAAPDTSDSQKVFARENGFAGVWHLSEAGNTNNAGYKDSSSHQAHATGIEMLPASRVDARIGKGAHLHNPKGQDTARWIRVTGEKTAAFNPGTNSPITVSIWALGHSYPIRSYETMIAKGDTSWTLQRVQYSTGQGYQCCVRATTYHLCSYNFAHQPLVTNQWLHFMAVLEEPSIKLYINGQLNSTQSAGPWKQGAHDLGIGNQTQILQGRRQWDGILDEPRVMTAARSAAWAKLDFESQRENQTLLNFP